MPNIFPTDYNDEGDAASTDKVWSSDGITNFNLTVDEIGTRNFLDRTTSNLSEGTNLYYTDGRVASAPAVTTLETNTTDSLALKADKTNVLELNNTTVFTPDAEYEPATKKYVDDSGTTFSTTEQALTGTSTNTVMSPKLTDDNYGVTIGAGTTFLLGEANERRTTTSTTFVKVKEIVCRAAGTYTVYYEASSTQIGGGSGDRNNESRVYKNGVGFGTLNANTSESGSPTTYSQDLTFARGDLIQIYFRRVDTGDANALVINMSVKYNVIAFKKYIGTINLD